VRSSRPIALALVFAITFGAAAPASAAPLRRVVRLVMRFVEARHVVDQARDLRARPRVPGEPPPHGPRTPPPGKPRR